jgi:hypothetical protein
VLTAALMAGCSSHDDAPGSTPDGVARPTAAKPPPCASSLLRAEGYYERASGSVFGYVVVWNSSDGACAIAGGRPLVRAREGARDVRLETGNPRLFDVRSPARIVLAPGRPRQVYGKGPRGAGFYLEWFASCVDARAVTLSVLLPGLDTPVPLAGGEKPVLPSCYAGATADRLPASKRRTVIAVSDLIPRLERYSPF